MRRATWILWLMMALLPLRGWASVGMGVASADAARGVSIAVSEGAASVSTASAPCHESVADAGHINADAGSHTCSLCDVCHSVALMHEAYAPPASHTTPGAAPAWQGESWADPECGGPFKPPRL